MNSLLNMILSPKTVISENIPIKRSIQTAILRLILAVSENMINASILKKTVTQILRYKSIFMEENTVTADIL